MPMESKCNVQNMPANKTTKQQNNKQNVLCRYTCNVHYQIGPGPQTTPEGRTACWLTAVFFIVAANRLTWTLSVVSPSVEGQFSISYMRRQAAVQLFINASILVLKTSVFQGRQRFVLNDVALWWLSAEVQVEESLCSGSSDITGYKNTATLLTGVKYSSAH